MLSKRGKRGAFLLCNRHRTGGSDDLIGIGAGGEIEEGLSGFAEGLAGAGGQDEGALNGVGAVQHGLLRGGHAAHGQSFDAVLHSGEGGVADGVGVAGHSGDHIAGGGQLLVVLAGFLGACDRLEAVPGAGPGLTADEGDLQVVTAHVLPIGDLAGVDLGDLLHAEVAHRIGGVDDDGDAVQRHDSLGEGGFLLILQGAAGKADVAGAVDGGLDAGSGAGGVIGEVDVGIHLHESLTQGADDLLHGSRAVGGHIPGELGRLGRGLGGLHGGGRLGGLSRGGAAAAVGAAREEARAQGQGEQHCKRFLHCFSFSNPYRFLGTAFSIPALCKVRFLLCVNSS